MPGKDPKPFEQFWPCLEPQSDVLATHRDGRIAQPGQSLSGSAHPRLVARWAMETRYAQGLKKEHEVVSQHTEDSAKGIKVVTVTLHHADGFILLDREDREY